MKKINIGATEDPKLLNLGKTCTNKEKWEFIKLFKEFQDIFAWSYDDLKAYVP